MKKIKMTMAARRLYQQRHRLMNAKHEYNLAKQNADGLSGTVNLCAWSICDDLLRGLEIPDSVLSLYKEYRNRAYRATSRFEKAQENLLTQNIKYREMCMSASAHDVSLSTSIP